MLDGHVDLVGLDGDGIANALSLAIPPAIFERQAALLVIDRGLAITGDGRRIELGGEDVDTSPAGLRRLRQRLGVRAIIAAPSEILSDVYAAAADDVLRQPDLVRQCLVVYREIHRRRSAITTDPPLLDSLPPLHADTLDRAFQLFVPDRATVVAYVFESRTGPLFTSLIAEKNDGVITSIAMHPAVADIVPRSALRAWPTEYRSITDAVTRRFSAPSIAVFTDVACLLRLRTGDPDSLAREVAGRQLIIDPMPPWLIAIVGGSAAVAMAQRSADVAMRFLPKRARALATAGAQAAKSQLSKGGIASLERTLGFDPFALWQSLAAWYRN